MERKPDEYIFIGNMHLICPDCDTRLILDLSVMELRPEGQPSAEDVLRRFYLGS